MNVVRITGHVGERGEKPAALQPKSLISVGA